LSWSWAVVSQIGAPTIVLPPRVAHQDRDRLHIAGGSPKLDPNARLTIDARSRKGFQRLGEGDWRHAFAPGRATKEKSPGRNRGSRFNERSQPPRSYRTAGRF
jgi:hypothetical protein